MENFTFRTNVMQNFGGVKVKAGYEQLITFMNCRKDFSKSSVSLSPPVQQLLPQQTSMGLGNQRAGKYMVGNVIMSRTLKPIT